MKIAIVDDIYEDADRIRHTVQEYADINSMMLNDVRIFTGGEELLSEFKPGSFDIIFLDIYMNGINGLDTARRIRSLGCECRIIFITSSPDFAVDSYEVDAAYYLLKPFGRDSIFKALDRSCQEFNEQSLSVKVPSRGSLLRLKLHSISYSEYVNRSILVHLIDGENVEVSMNQRDFSALLLQYDCFCDCIKGILINFEDVYKLLSDRFIMKSGASIPISRLKYQEVRRKYLDYTFKALREGQEL